MIGTERLAYMEAKRPRPADDFTRGVIAGAAGEVFGAELEAVESACRADGADECAFVASPADPAGKGGSA